VSCYDSCLARRARLRAEHGPAERLTDTASALRLLGVRSWIHPADVLAFTYREPAAAFAYARANARASAIESLGIAVTETGTAIGALDLRREYPAAADPAWPDTWRHGDPEPLAG
jgi:hypothetical protein